jgi:transcriptional regulator with PAS, ATPase and Fis domain
MKQIQPFVQKIIETMSTVLDVEITVVDHTLERIAGTGKFKLEIGQKIPESYVLNKVIKAGQQYIVENPGSNEVCDQCLHFKHCNETAIIALPILSDHQIIGGMCLVAFSELQRTKLLMNRENLLIFIKHFSELISTKALEQKLVEKSQLLSEQLINVIDAIDAGIVVTDKQGGISLVNSYVKKKINSHIEGKWLCNPIKKFLPEIAIDRVLSQRCAISYQKTFIKNGDNTTQIIYSLIPVCVSDVVEGTILIFHISEDAQKIIHRITEAKDLVTFDDILGTSRIFRECKSKAEMAAKNDSTILLLGESGTGKELFAQAIHHFGKRAKGPFIAMNCAAIPDNLLESELFGYERGAFTGARHEGKIGKFDLADKGTILLDEIADMDIVLQAKVLRVLEEKSFERIGGTKRIKVDVRIIASTSKNLDEMVERGTFRSDLYYRISTIPVFIPPLRQRKGDIKIYLDYFLRHFNYTLDKEIKGFTNEAEEMLNQYGWPGNVRELKNAVEYAVNMETSAYIGLKNLPERIKSCQTSDGYTCVTSERNEKRIVMEKLEKYGNTTMGKRMVAKEMNISLATLYRKIKKYHLP